MFNHWNRNGDWGTENGITNVVSFIKHNYCLLCEVSGYHLSDLRVQHVGIVKHYYISLLQLGDFERERERQWDVASCYEARLLLKAYSISCSEVGTPSFLVTKLFQIILNEASVHMYV